MGRAGWRWSGHGEGTKDNWARLRSWVNRLSFHKKGQLEEGQGENAEFCVRFATLMFLEDRQAEIANRH